MHPQSDFIKHSAPRSPQNVLLTGTGRAKLADFGLAQSLSRSDTHLPTERQGACAWALWHAVVLLRKPVTHKRAAPDASTRAL